MLARRRWYQLIGGVVLVLVMSCVLSGVLIAQRPVDYSAFPDGVVARVAQYELEAAHVHVQCTSLSQAPCGAYYEVQLLAWSNPSMARVLVRVRLPAT
jgi:Tfp pilus assembly protein PilN